MTKGLTGTPIYTSPEIIQTGISSFKNDMWALGVTFYVILIGKFPFFGKNYQELAEKICSGQYKMPENISENWRAIINWVRDIYSSKIYHISSSNIIFSFLFQLLQMDPLHRLSIEKMLEILN